MTNLSDSQYQELLELMEVAEGYSGASDWEKNFIKDTRERLDKYQERVMFSPKQFGVLRKIVDKAQGKGDRR